MDNTINFINEVTELEAKMAELQVEYQELLLQGRNSFGAAFTTDDTGYQIRVRKNNGMATLTVLANMPKPKKAKAAKVSKQALRDEVEALKAQLQSIKGEDGAEILVLGGSSEVDESEETDAAQAI